jgi:hypothetical protein
LKSYKHVLALTAAWWTAFAPISFASDMSLGLENTKGKVLINQGKGYAPFAAGLRLRHGDRILIGDDGAAMLVMQGCEISLSAASVFTVPAKPICASGESVAAEDGVFVSPVAATSPAGLLKQVISKTSTKQRLAAQQGLNATSTCLNAKIVKMKSLQDFIRRNPGVEPTGMISDLDADANSCHEMQPMQKTKTITQPQPVQPIVVAESAPIVSSEAAAGIDSTTLLIGGAGLLAAGGVAAYLVLKPVSGP